MMAITIDPSTGQPGQTVCQCRACKKWGYTEDEFTSPYTGLCANCSHARSTGVLKASIPQFRTFNMVVGRDGRLTLDTHGHRHEAKVTGWECRLDFIGGVPSHRIVLAVVGDMKTTPLGDEPAGVTVRERYTLNPTPWWSSVRGRRLVVTAVGTFGGCAAAMAMWRWLGL